jgi:hypothetical protein
MARIVKKGSLLQAHQVQETIFGPGPDGGSLIIASAGDYATYQETEDGEYVFKGIISEKEFYAKHRRI